EVHVVGEVLPGSRHAFDLGLAAELAVGAYLLGDTAHLSGERAQLVDHRVHGGADAQKLALHRLAGDLQGHLLREVAFRDGDDDSCDLSRRSYEVVYQRIDRVDARSPRAGGGSEGSTFGHA